MISLLIVFVISSTILVGLSIPLIRLRIAPNSWYGFRTQATLRDPDVWYSANAYAGWRMLWTGVVMLVTSVVTFLVPGIDVATYGFIMLAVVATGVVFTCVQSFLFLRQLEKKQRRTSTRR